MNAQIRRQLKILTLSAVVVGVAFLALTPFTRPSSERVTRVEYVQSRAQLIAIAGVYLISLHDRSHEALLRYREGQGRGDLERVRADRAEMQRVSEALLSQLDTSWEHEVLARYESSRQQLTSSDEQLVEAVRRGRPREVAALVDKTSLHREQADAHLHALLSASNRHLQSVIEDAKAHEKRARWTLVARALTLGFVLWLLLQIIWSILRPLRQLTDAVDRFSQGNPSVGPMIEVKHGQLGKLSRAFERMRNRIVETHQMLELRIAQRTCELRRNQDRLELAIAASEAGLWDWEPQRKRVTYNESWARVLGHDYAELDSDEDSFFAKVHPADVESVRSRFEAHLNGQCPHFESEHRVRRKSGDWCWVAEHGRVVERDEQGQPIRVIGLMRDVSIRHEAEEELLANRLELQNRSADLASINGELERKNEEMAQFVYTVSHDLKSPLVTMKGFVGVLNEDLSTGDIDLARDSLSRIDKAATHMSRLIEDLLRLSRAGRTRGDVTLVDVSAMLRDVTVDLRPRLEELGTTLVIEDGMPEIMADREAISRVFENLLNNAVKYGCTGPDSRIEVGSETVDGEVRYFVRDNGPGVAPEYHEKVFGLFQRLESDQDGTGIGLAIVAKIMHAHEGRVWVESSPGDGATFWLAFDTAREAVSV